MTLPYVFYIDQPGGICYNTARKVRFMKRVLAFFFLFTLLLAGCGNSEPAATVGEPGEPISFTAFVVEPIKEGWLVKVTDPQDTYFLPGDLVAVTTELEVCVPGDYLEITYDSNLTIPYPWAVEMTLNVEKTGKTLDDLLSLEEAAAMALPDLKTVVLGLSQAELHHAWGEPGKLILETWTEIWECGNQRITVYFSHHGQVERVEKEEIR